MATETTKEKKPGRFAEIRRAPRHQEIDPRIGWFMLLAALVTFAVSSDRVPPRGTVALVPSSSRPPRRAPRRHLA